MDSNDCYSFFRKVAEYGYKDIASKALRVYEIDPVYGRERALKYIGDTVPSTSPLRTEVMELLKA